VLAFAKNVESGAPLLAGFKWTARGWNQGRGKRVQ
jgi:hypothetical protein